MSTTIDKRYEEYGPRVLDFLEKIRAEVVKGGEWDADEPHDVSGDDYQWSLVVWPKDNGYAGSENCVDISVELAEAASYGDDEVFDGRGVNWGLSVVEYGGQILGALTPYNYTDQCWVDASDEAVEDRWRLIEGADVGEIVGLLKKGG